MKHPIATLFFIWAVAAPIWSADEVHRYYLPHFTLVAGQWSTILSLSNPSDDPVEILIHAFSNDGVSSGEVTLTLGPRSGFSQPIDHLIPHLTTDRGWLQIDAPSSILTGIMTFENVATRGTSSLLLNRQSHQYVICPLVENSQDRASGFAIVNTSDQGANLRLSIFNLEDDSKTSLPITLAARSKIVQMMATTFGGDLPSHARLEIESDQSIQAFALTFQDHVSQIIAVPGVGIDASPLAQLSGLDTTVASSYSNLGVDAGVTVGVKLKGHELSLMAHGWSDIENQIAMDPRSIIEIGSVTKTFVATLIFKLIEAGTLSLEDTLDQFSDFPNGEKITLKMLLNHTSGIKNYTEDPDFLQMAPNFAYNLNDLLDFVRNDALVSEPGSEWHYANTNYILLQQIIESQYGTSFGQSLRTHILEPLKMGDTYYLVEEPIDRARAYQGSGEATLDVTDIIDLSWASGAGGMASTARDLITFGRALFDGRLLKQETLALMLADAVPASAGVLYAHGMFQTTLPDGSTAYYHNGVSSGGVAQFGHIPEKDLTLAVLINQRTSQDLLGPFVQNILTMPGLLEAPGKP